MEEYSESENKNKTNSENNTFIVFKSNEENLIYSSFEAS